MIGLILSSLRQIQIDLKELILIRIEMGSHYDYKRLPVGSPKPGRTKIRPAKFRRPVHRQSLPPKLVILSE